jgi:very-short-patch-repair endonuclease
MGERRRRDGGPVPARTLSFRAREQAMWELLRDRRLQGIKFRRQSPLGIFVADFFCHELKLVVELDGAVHDDPRQVAHDKNRDFYLASLGCTILRFPNCELFENADAVLTRILEVAKALRSASIPPLPPGEGARG